MCAVLGSLESYLAMAACHQHSKQLQTVDQIAMEDDSGITGQLLYTATGSHKSFNVRRLPPSLWISIYSAEE